MRNLRRRPILLLTVTLALGISWGCSDKGLFGSKEDAGFEGRVDYEVDFDLPPERQQMAAMIPKKEKVYVRGGMTRLEREISMGARMVLIDDPEKDSLVMLMKAEGMGLDPSRIPMARDTGKLNFEYLEQDTVILERACKKAILKQEMQGQTAESPVWYTEEIQGEPFRQFQGLGGLPLRFESKARGAEVVKQATNIVEKELADSLFDAHPEGYTTRSIEEFQQMMGGGAP